MTIRSQFKLDIGKLVLKSIIETITKKRRSFKQKKWDIEMSVQIMYPGIMRRTKFNEYNKIIYLFTKEYLLKDKLLKPSKKLGIVFDYSESYVFWGGTHHLKRMQEYKMMKNEPMIFMKYLKKSN